MLPVYLLFYWSGDKIPEWRLECWKRLQSLYPDAKTIEYYEENDDDIFQARTKSDLWRIEQVAKYRNCLWCDNDIYLDCRLDLPEAPAMADEYRVAHYSIMWSGNNPYYFKDKTVDDLFRDKKVHRVEITGTHWASDINGNKCEREKS